MECSNGAQLSYGVMVNQMASDKGQISLDGLIYNKKIKCIYITVKARWTIHLTD